MIDGQKKRIGVMGGTFDPIHYGHLYIAECSRYEFNLAQVLFIPSGQPVHKKREDITNATHRMEMTGLAISSNPFFALSNVEVLRPGPTYTVDTLEHLNDQCGGRHEFFFITGADAILEIVSWKDVTRVFELCQFIAVARPGFSLDAMNRVSKNLSPTQKAKVHIHETSGILISSTDIRNRISRGEPVKYLTPDSVLQYITSHGLYR